VVGPRASSNPKAAVSTQWDEESNERDRLDAAVPDPPSAQPTAAPSDALPPWARFPHVDPSRDGRAFDSQDSTAADSRAEENERVLREIDRLQDEVRGRVRPGDPAPAAAPPPTVKKPDPPAKPVERPATANRVDPWESPNSYLEERLRLADSAAADLGRDVRSIAETWSRVGARMNELESEVRAAHAELGFIHAAARGWDTLPSVLPSSVLPQRAPVALPIPAPRPARARPTGALPAPSIAAAAPAAYAGFTADRYNRTIGALKERRRRLAGWTFVSAGLISLVLVLITAFAKESMPPMWLAVLPAVWMIPVPFFVLSFRGTQRVLRHNHLEVPGGPP
jgi:hypothetical protein